MIKNEHGDKYIGGRYGRWTVLEYKYSDSKSNKMYKCRCDCGTTKIVRISHMTNKKSKSCGCYSRELHQKHNMSATKIYHIWLAVHDRCRNPKNPSYKNYGGRGIKVSAKWSGKNGFANFYRDMGERPEGKSLDRIDNNKGYSKENCRWATNEEQWRNKNYIELYEGLSKKEWSLKLTSNKDAVWYRTNVKSMTFEQAVNDLKYAKT